MFELAYQTRPYSLYSIKIFSFLFVYSFKPVITHSNLVPYQFGFIQSKATQPILMAAQALRSFQDDSMSTRRILTLFYIKKKKLGYSGINSHSGHTRFYHTYIKETEHNIHYPNPKDGTITSWDYRPISL